MVGSYSSSAFGGQRVYALDSNNGLIAQNLDLACVPAPLSFTRSGSDMVFSWGRRDYRFQVSAAFGPGGPVWSDIAGGTASPVTVSVRSGIKFFRLVCP